MHGWQKFREDFNERPIAAVVTYLAVALCLHFPAKLIEESVISYINHSIAESLGLSRPEMKIVIDISISWLLPLMAAALVLLVYHATRRPAAINRTSSAFTTQIAPPSNQRREGGFSPWFMAIVAVAIFSIGELSLSRPNPIGPQGERGEQGPPGPAGPQGDRGPPGQEINLGIPPEGLRAITKKINLEAKLEIMEPHVVNVKRSCDTAVPTLLNAIVSKEEMGASDRTPRLPAVEDMLSRMIAEVQTSMQNIAGVARRIYPKDEIITLKKPDENYISSTVASDQFKIVSNELRHQYKELFFTCQQANKEIQDLKNKIQQETKHLRAQISELSVPD
jgi:hypothetical protein